MVCGDWNKLDWLNYFSSVFNLMERDQFEPIFVNNLPVQKWTVLGDDSWPPTFDYKGLVMQLGSFALNLTKTTPWIVFIKKRPQNRMIYRWLNR